MLTKIKNRLLKNILTTILCSVIFLAISLPFSQLFPILNFTEIRPAAALYPAFGLIFGFWGALSCAIGNLLLDIIQGKDITLCIQSFFIQFAISYLTYVLWYCKIKKKNQEKEVTPPVFNKTSNILKYNFIVLICSLFGYMVLGSLLQIKGYTTLFCTNTLIIFFNHLVFGILLGIPIVTLLTKIKDLPHTPKDKDIKKSGVILGNITMTIATALHISMIICAICINNIPKWLFLSCILSTLVFLFISPLSPAKKEEKNQKFIFSINEKMILNYTTSGILLTLITGLVVYAILFETNKSTVEIWEKICCAVVVVINVFFIITTITVRFIEKKITIPIIKISESVSLYDANDNKGSIPEIHKSCQSLIYENNEIGEMATAIVNMLDDIENYTETIKENALERERTLAQLEIAAKIQTDLLPHNFSDYQNMGIDLYGIMTPARVVGGDFYDFYSVDNDNVSFVIGDVSGKGIPAALFMSMSKMLIKMYVCTENNLEEAVNKVNTYICQNNSMEMFLTAFIGVYNMKNNTLTYVNAGHNYPVLLKDGIYSTLSSKSNLMLGAFDDVNYTSNTIVLNKNDCLFMYTDGLTEAKNKTGKMFGENRVIELLNNSIDYSAENTLKNIASEVNNFSLETEQFDDITMLCFKICPKNSLIIEAVTNKLHTVLNFIEQFFNDKDISLKDKKSIKIIVEEIFVNICHYSYENSIGKAEISVRNYDTGIAITFTDSGKPFNPLKQPNPDLTKDIVDMKIGGLGIFMVKEICDNITYEYSDNKNILTVFKKFE